MLELKEIGLRVASLRETCGLTATDMAEKLEIGIPANEKTIAELKEIGNVVGLNYDDYFKA